MAHPRFSKIIPPGPPPPNERKKIFSCRGSLQVFYKKILRLFRFCSIEKYDKWVRSNSRPLISNIKYIGFLTVFLGVLAALHYRDRTGQGQFLEVAQCEALLRAMDWTWVYAGLTGKNRAQAGNRDPSAFPSGVYPCLDGFVAVAAGR
ncbi:MAG: CoA transferase, partial [Elusimicrobia bacterium]|nr:CoA transferase [Elusimicrobiota bacterium]